MPNSVSLPTPLILAALFIAPFLFGRTLTAARQSSVDTVITVDRRSVMKYKGKASEEVIQKALLAAIHAPNHWLNEPWRFYRLGPESRGKLGELNPDKAAVFAGVPDMFVVTVVPSMAMLRVLIVPKPPRRVARRSGNRVWAPRTAMLSPKVKMTARPDSEMARAKRPGQFRVVHQ